MVSEISLGEYDSTETSTSVFRARQKFASKGATSCCRWKHVLIMLCVILVSTVLALVIGIAIYVTDGELLGYAQKGSKAV